jgi:hypothetical protein
VGKETDGRGGGEMNIPRTNAEHMAFQAAHYAAGPISAIDSCWLCGQNIAPQNCYKHRETDEWLCGRHWREELTFRRGEKPAAPSVPPPFVQERLL